VYRQDAFEYRVLKGTFGAEEIQSNSMLKDAAQGAQKSVFLARYFKIDRVCSTCEREVNCVL